MGTCRGLRKPETKNQGRTEGFSHGLCAAVAGSAAYYWSIKCPMTPLRYHPRIVLLALLAVPTVFCQQQPWSCRFAPGSKHSNCGLPFSLSNFQGYYACNATVKVGRPATIDALQAIVEEFPKVKAVGVGHSWWGEQFCAGDGPDAVNIVTTELKPTLDMILRPVDPKRWLNETIPEDFPIKVDEKAKTVTVAAGIPQRILLDYLAAYTHWEEPAGWTLPAFTWFIDQTIGGAVATNSHGSSLRHGSLSSQVLSLKVVLANGTLAEVNATSHPHLFRALGVNVGRLGVVTELTMKILPQQAVVKSLQVLNFTQFAEQIWEVQEAYVAGKDANDTEGVKDALFHLDETQAFWYPASDKVYRVDYEHVGHTPDGVIENIENTFADEPLVQGMSGPSEDFVFDQVPRQPQRGQPRLTAQDAKYWSTYYEAAGSEYVRLGTYPSRKAFLSMTEPGTRLTANFAPYDQFEVSVPLELAGTCLLEVGEEVYGPAALWNGFRTPPLIRFVSGEDFYLSNNHGGPRMFVNMEDYLSHTTGRENTEFLKTVGIFRDKCEARLHWGKNGWNQFARCFDGAEEYPDSWCHFGCAVEELDPEDKFSSTSNVWAWNATRNSKSVPFASCCIPGQGFSPECQCASSAACKN